MILLDALNAEPERLRSAASPPPGLRLLRTWPEGSAADMRAAMARIAREESAVSAYAVVCLARGRINFDWHSGRGQLYALIGATRTVLADMERTALDDIGLYKASPPETDA